VRDAVGAGADGAHDDADGAYCSRGTRPFGARTHGLAVAAAVAGALGTAREEHDLAFDGTGGQRLQRSEIFDHHDRRDEALIGGTDAAADRDGDHRLRVGREHLGARLAAHPARDDHFGRTHLGEAEVDEFAACPFDPGEIARGACEPRTDLGGERGEELQRLVALDRLIAQLCSALERCLRRSDLDAA